MWQIFLFGINIIFNKKGRDWNLSCVDVLPPTFLIALIFRSSALVRTPFARRGELYFLFCNLQSGFPCLEMGRAGACNEHGVTCAAMRGERSGGHTYPLLNRRNSITRRSQPVMSGGKSRGDTFLSLRLSVQSCVRRHSQKYSINLTDQMHDDIYIYLKLLN